MLFRSYAYCAHFSDCNPRRTRSSTPRCTSFRLLEPAAQPGLNRVFRSQNRSPLGNIQGPNQLPTDLSSEGRFVCQSDICLRCYLLPQDVEVCVKSKLIGRPSHAVSDAPEIAEFSRVRIAASPTNCNPLWRLHASIEIQSFPVGQRNSRSAASRHRAV